STPAQSDSATVRGFGFTQWWTLVGRNIILKVRDRAQGIILLVQAPLFAILVGGVFGKLRLAEVTKLPNFARRLTGIEFLMVVAAIGFGCNNVARDVVGEWTVFQRERMVSLKLPSYIFSKLAVAAILSFFQCLTLLGIVTLFCSLQANLVSVLGILYLSS